MLDAIRNLLRVFRFRGHESTKRRQLSLERAGHSHLFDNYISSDDLVMFFEKSEDIGASHSIGRSFSHCQ